MLNNPGELDYHSTPYGTVGNIFHGVVHSVQDSPILDSDVILKVYRVRFLYVLPVHSHIRKILWAMIVSHCGFVVLAVQPGHSHGLRRWGRYDIWRLFALSIWTALPRLSRYAPEDSRMRTQRIVYACRNPNFPGKITSLRDFPSGWPLRRVYICCDSPEGRGCQ